MSFHVRPIREVPEARSSALQRLIKRVVSLWSSVSVLRGILPKRNREDAKDEKRITVLKSVVTILVSLLCALLLLAGTFKILLTLRVLSFSGIMSMAAAKLPEDEHGFTNVLLLGEGNSDHDGVDLTDTMMIASIDPATKSVVMLSIPRDAFMLKTEKMGRGRMNSLYRNYKIELQRQGMAAGEASRQSLNELMAEIGNIVDVQIHGTIKINFSGFEQAIDALGGIDVEVPEDIVDTQYPGPNYTYETFAIRKGLQHLDGATALKYARSRHTTSDFSRSARQQQIIAAAMKKATDSGMIKNVSRITDLLSILSKNIESTISTRELIGLAALGKTLDHSRMVSMQLNDQNGLYDGIVQPGGFLYAPPRDEFEGASVLLPVSIPEFPVTWKQVHALGTLLFVHRDLYFRAPRIAVLNNGAKQGMARKLGGDLYRYGLNVVAIRNYDKELPSLSQDTSFISLVLPPAGPDGETTSKEDLERLNRTVVFLSDTLTVQRVDPVGPAALADEPEIVIVLGKDYDYLPLQDLLAPR